MKQLVTLRAGRIKQRSLKVLVVEDNLDVAEAMGWVLEKMGHDYRIARKGRQALATARAICFLRTAAGCSSSPSRS